MLSVCFMISCSPRDFLTRRLAADLVAGSDAFKSPQQFWLHTGVISNKDFLAPEYMVLQRHGWITGSNANCPPDINPSPCWDVALTPAGVNVFHDLISGDPTQSQYFSVTVARRELLDVTGIAKNGNQAEVDFRWKWVPLNAVGSALYNESVEYNSTVGFRHYDDGWRLIEGTTQRAYQGMDDSLKSAQPAQ